MKRTPQSMWIAAVEDVSTVAHQLLREVGRYPITTRADGRLVAGVAVRIFMDGLPEWWQSVTGVSFSAEGATYAKRYEEVAVRWLLRGSGRRGRSERPRTELAKQLRASAYYIVTGIHKSSHRTQAPSEAPYLRATR